MNWCISKTLCIFHESVSAMFAFGLAATRVGPTHRESLSCKCRNWRLCWKVVGKQQPLRTVENGSIWILFLPGWGPIDLMIWYIFCHSRCICPHSAHISCRFLRVLWHPKLQPAGGVESRGVHSWQSWLLRWLLLWWKLETPWKRGGNTVEFGQLSKT